MSLFSDFDAETIIDLIEDGLSDQLKDFLNGFSLSDLLNNEPSAQELMEELKELQSQLTELDTEVKAIATEIEWTSTQILIEPIAVIIQNAIRDFNQYASVDGPDLPPGYTDFVKDQVGGEDLLPNALANFHEKMLSAADGKSTFQIFMDRLIVQAKEDPSSASVGLIGINANNYISQQFAFQLAGTEVLQACYLDYDPPLTQKNQKQPSITANNLKNQFKAFAPTLPALSVILTSENKFSLKGQFTNASTGDKPLTAVITAYDSQMRMSEVKGADNYQTFVLQQHKDGTFQFRADQTKYAGSDAFVYYVKEGKVDWWNGVWTYGAGSLPTSNTYWRFIPVEGKSDTTYYIFNQESGQYLGINPSGDVQPLKATPTEEYQWSFKPTS